MARPGLPICILTGFLGAGKTTLLNHILRNRQGLRAAVFVNEFGKVEVDTTLIKMQASIDEDRLVTLDNGCICCEVNADLVGQLRRVLNKFSGALDFVVIETSGICDPGPVLATLERVEDLDVLTHLDSVVALVDAGTLDAAGLAGLGAGLGLAATTKSQVALSDIVLLNKCDIIGGIDSEEAGKAESLLRSELDRTGASSTRIIRTEHAAVDLELVVSLARDRSADGRHGDLLLQVDGGLGVGQPGPKRPRRELPALVGHGGTGLRAGVHSFVYEAKRPFDPLKFEAWLENTGTPPSICRAKGLLWMHGIPQTVVFQLAGGRTNPFETVAEKPSQTRVVFIGESRALKESDEQKVVAELNACLR